MNWLKEKNYSTETYMNSKVLLTPAQVNDLANYSTRITIDGLINGDYKEWCSSLIWFPVDFIQDSQASIFDIGKLNSNLFCFPIKEYDKGAYTVGEIYYSPTFNDFRDYEPYTTAQLYLPFYGFIDIKIADVINKYIQIRIQIDKGTGQACYIIGVNDNSVYITNPPFLNDVDDTNTRILTQHTFQLGVTIPLGSVNAIDTARNIINSAVKGVASITSAYVSASTGLGISTSSTKTKQITKAKNKKTGRFNIVKKVNTTSDREYDNTNYLKSRGMSEIFDTSADVLTKIHITPTTDRPNNTIINSLNTTEVVLVRKYCNMKNVDEDYRKLYGVPLGEVKTLNTIHGYTEISKIHIEGVDFGTATQTEIAMLEEILSDGVILP